MWFDSGVVKRVGDGTPRRRQVARAALTSGSVEVASRVLMAFVSIAVARVLQPAEVGVLGLGVIVVGVVSLVAGGAETASVVSRGEGTDAQYAFGGFIIRAVFTGCGGVAMAGFLPRMAEVLTGNEQLDERFTTVTTILAWQLGCELAGSYPRVILQRRLDLSYLAAVSLVQVVIHVCLTLLILASGEGLVGLAWAALASTGVIVPMLWARLLQGKSSIWEGTGAWNLWHQVASATVKLLAAGGVGYLNGRVDNLLVAGAVGPTAMSFYAMAWNMSRFVPIVTGQVFISVLVPTLAKLQSDARSVERFVNEVLRHTYLVFAPVCVLVFVSAPTLVAIVLGEHWAPLVPCLQLMMITAMIGPLVSMLGALLLVSGLTHRGAGATFGQFVVLIATIVPLVKAFGLVGAAFGDLVAVFVLTAILWIAVPQHFRVLLWSALASVFRTGASAAVVGLAAWIAGQQIQVGAFREAIHFGIVLAGYPALLAATGGMSLLTEAAVTLSLSIRRAR